MSTKIKKLYSKADVADAKVENERVRNYFSRKSERRKTVQIRISEEWHFQLKELAKEEGLILSFLIDRICHHFFKNCIDYKKREHKNSAETMRSDGSLLN